MILSQLNHNIVKEYTGKTSLINTIATGKYMKKVLNLIIFTWLNLMFKIQRLLDPIILSQEFTIPPFYLTNQLTDTSSLLTIIKKYIRFIFNIRRT